MKFTLSWLKEHLDTDATLEAVTEALTRIGLEVEGVENPAAKLEGFRVARVLTAERHRPLFARHKSVVVVVYARNPRNPHRQPELSRSGFATLF